MTSCIFPGKSTVWRHIDELEAVAGTKTHAVLQELPGCSWVKTGTLKIEGKGDNLSR